MIIEAVNIDDASSLLDIYSYYVKNTAVSFEYDVPTMEEFRGRIEGITEKYPYIKATENDEIVGYAYASAFKSRRAYDWAVELSVYVKPECRQRGIGRELYLKLFDILGKMGIVNVNACITSPRREDNRLNDDSRKFHTKMGFELVGKFHQVGYKFNTWYDMIWMEKSVGEHKDNQPEVHLGQWRELL